MKINKLKLYLIHALQDFEINYEELSPNTILLSDSTKIVIEENTFILRKEEYGVKVSSKNTIKLISGISNYFHYNYYELNKESYILPINSKYFLISFPTKSFGVSSSSFIPINKDLPIVLKIGFVVENLTSIRKTKIDLEKWKKKISSELVKFGFNVKQIGEYIISISKNNVSFVLVRFPFFSVIFTEGEIIPISINHSIQLKNVLSQIHVGGDSL